MVKGLDRFRVSFEAYQDRFILIGGTASILVLEEAGLDFRATKDLDIVLCIERFDAEFARAFWNFYQIRRLFEPAKEHWETSALPFPGTERRRLPIHDRALLPDSGCISHG